MRWFSRLDCSGLTLEQSFLLVAGGDAMKKTYHCPEALGLRHRHHARQTSFNPYFDFSGERLTLSGMSVDPRFPVDRTGRSAFVEESQVRTIAAGNLLRTQFGSEPGKILPSNIASLQAAEGCVVRRALLILWLTHKEAVDGLATVARTSFCVVGFSPFRKL